jgi:hypothetical protein
MEEVATADFLFQSLLDQMVLLVKSKEVDYERMDASVEQVDALETLVDN